MSKTRKNSPYQVGFSQRRMLYLLLRRKRPTKEYVQMPRQHQSKAITKAFKELERLGFTVTQKKSGSYIILPPSNVDGPIYNTHGTESALHPMRRDFKRMYGIQLKV